MRRNFFVFFLVASAIFAFGASQARANSFTGTLPTSESTFDVTLSLSATSTVVLQTYGFGEGETDPFLAIFAGTGSSASILTDAFSNPFGTSLDLSNYDSFAGCPPAATVVIGGSPVCGDITMTLPSLAAGNYTIVLSDGQYIANAVFDNGTLGEGFTDFTGGQFCNIDINGVACPNTSGTFALDITGLDGAPLPEGTTTTVTPEPSPLLLLATGLLAFAWRFRAAERLWTGYASRRLGA